MNSLYSKTLLGYFLMQFSIVFIAVFSIFKIIALSVFPGFLLSKIASDNKDRLSCN